MHSKFSKATWYTIQLLHDIHEYALSLSQGRLGSEWYQLLWTLAWGTPALSVRHVRTLRSDGVWSFGKVLLVSESWKLLVLENSSDVFSSHQIPKHGSIG